MINIVIRERKEIILVIVCLPGDDKLFAGLKRFALIILLRIILVLEV
jgi:hypothetical protein